MITLSTADKALKSVYLGVIGNQLNYGANALLSRIKQTTNNVYGNEIIKSTSYGISGGIGAGSETDALAQAVNKKYAQFKTTLKNLYGTLEISDKAIRCSQNNAGAFVNLLNEEMESLIKSSTFNLGRMLYGDGTGVLGKITVANEEADTEFTVDNVRNFAINQCVKLLSSAGTGYNATYNSMMVVENVDVANSKIILDHPAEASFKDLKLAVANGFNRELTGLGAIFGTSSTLYGVNRSQNKWLKPYTKTAVGNISESAMQTAIDEIADTAGSDVDFIACSSKVRRYYQDCIKSYKRNIDVMDLQGGFRALTYNGIPVVNDRFVADGDMYLLSTKDFELCQLGDWEWIEGNDGRIIKQKEGYPTYTATLVKYAELICNRPNSQAKLTGITG